MTNKTAINLIGLGVKHLVQNQIANGLPQKYESLLKQIPAQKPEIELITKKELMRRLDISKATVSRRMLAGMPFIKRGKPVYFEYEKVVEWLEWKKHDR